MKIVLFLVLSANILAQSYRGSGTDLPKLELGAGIVRGTAPHYPGSDESNKVYIPFPAVIYRGDIIRADEDGGVRSRFFYSDRYELNLSTGAALPARTEDNDDRAGMPTLDPMIELGPGLIFHLISKKNKGPLRLSLNLPLRIVISSDFKDTRQRGYVFNPLLFSFYELNKKLTIFTSISGRWATKDFNDYIYTVEELYSTNTRAVYKAKKGNVLYSYSIAAIINRGQNFSIFGGISYENYKDNANKASPLFIREDNISTGLGITWWFYGKS